MKGPKVIIRKGGGDGSYERSVWACEDKRRDAAEPDEKLKYVWNAGTTNPESVSSY